MHSIHTVLRISQMVFVPKVQIVCSNRKFKAIKITPIHQKLLAELGVVLPKSRVVGTCPLLMLAPVPDTPLYFSSSS